MERLESASTPSAPESDSHRDALADSRRKFLKTAGRFAVYTPPAMYALMRPGKHAVAASAGPTPPKARYLQRIDASEERVSRALDRLRALFSNLQKHHGHP